MTAKVKSRYIPDKHKAWWKTDPHLNSYHRHFSNRHQQIRIYYIVEIGETARVTKYIVNFT